MPAAHPRHRSPGTPLLQTVTAIATALIASTALGQPAAAPPIAVHLAPAVNETGQPLPPGSEAVLREGIRAGLVARGLALAPRAAMVAEPRLLGCTEAGCLATLVVSEAGRRRFDTPVRAADPAALADGIAAALADGLRPASPTPGQGRDISATGASVRHLGGARFAVAGQVIDLRAITHGYDRAVDPDVLLATDITAGAPLPPGRHAAITLYQVDPPLTGLPSREPGIDRGTDFRDPAMLVKAAWSNYLSPVFTAEPVPVRVAGHPIGHFFVKVEIPGFPPLLTGMTTIDRSDAELVNLTLGRALGIGGVLLTPQPGRLNSAAEVVRELALRQRPLRVADGLRLRGALAGASGGPEFRFEDGRTVFARFLVPVTNATDALAFLVEHVARGGHERFGALIDRPFRGTGAGCAAFAVAWLQAAGVVPFITEPIPGPPPAAPEALGPTDTWRAWHARLNIPWAHLGCDERVGAAGVHPADYTIYDLLVHGESPAFIREASGGVVARLRENFGVVPATLFQLGAYTPLRDLLLNARRKDPGDRGDYSWNAPGLAIAYWDNARFSAWVRRVHGQGPRDARVRLAREGRFIGLEIDATGA
ncbi:MAG: hypothetical protein K2X74_18510, partial [Acetobacteraceae bacterium]|nr:hypothetical protein [Acetobacteraceae bacterium]